MLIDIFLIILIILLLLYVAYLNKLHYDEIKGLYSKLGIQLDITSNKEDIKHGKVKNHIKSKMKELERGGE